MEFGLGGALDNIKRDLQRAGINTGSVIEPAELSVSSIHRREGHHAEPSQVRAERIVNKHGRSLKRVLVVRDDNEYVVVDGVHRVRAAELMGVDVPALVMDRVAFNVLKDKYSGEQMHQWAHSVSVWSF